jgi:hypothetical protein
MANSEGNDFFHLFHLLWGVAAGVFWKLWTIVDKKANQDEVDDKHAQNIERLEEIKDLIREQQKESKEERYSIRVDLSRLNATVAILADRAGLDGSRRQ